MLDTSTKNHVLTERLGIQNKIRLPAKVIPSNSNGNAEQSKVPIFSWSTSDIPGVCVEFDCNHTVPVNLPKALVDLFHKYAKLLFEFPDGSHSLDLIKTRICVNLGVFWVQERAHRNATAQGYPEIDFTLVVDRIMGMEIKINLLVVDPTVRLGCIVWDYLVDDLKVAESDLLSLEKGKNIPLAIRQAARPG